MTVESGFRFLLPPGKSFRFCELTTYQSPLKRWSMSEMDFGYWDEDRKVLCLLELKDLSLPHVKAGEAAARSSGEERKAEIEKLKRQIKDNVKDVLVMLHAVWGQLGHGKALAGELPEPCRVRVPVQMFFVLKLPESAKGSMPPQGYKDAADSATRGYANLLDLNATAVVIDQWRARELQLPLSPINGDEPATSP